MRGKTKAHGLAMMLLFTVALFVSSPVFSAEITVVGEVNDTYQIVANGQIYEIAVTPIGDDLVMNHISEKVEVRGTLQETEETKMITVISFKVVTE